jgi:hypothetical protein
VSALTLPPLATSEDTRSPCIGLSKIEQTGQASTWVIDDQRCFRWRSH